jgi:hypothetical protein
VYVTVRSRADEYPIVPENPHDFVEIGPILVDVLNCLE